MNKTSNGQGKSYQVVLIVLVALAALSSATKDLERLQSFAAQMNNLVAEWSDRGVVTASAAMVTPSEIACSDSISQKSNGQAFRWQGRIDTGKAIEIKGLHGDISAEPASGNEVEVEATKTARTSDVNLVSIKVLEHEGGVTICAIYPTDDPNVFTPCRASRQAVPSDYENTNSSQVRNNDVQVSFKVKVPAGVDFLARTINGEVSAESMSSNVFAKTVNGSIKLSTTGFADAKTVNGEIFAKLGNANWTGSMNFKTVNGEINLELPASTGAVVNAKTFNGEISSDFPLVGLTKKSKRQLTGTIGGGGRELNMKTLNGSISLRRLG
jgi:DUF4097 and DUF4098 domain-containing protein YvlB